MIAVAAASQDHTAHVLYVGEDDDDDRAAAAAAAGKRKTCLLLLPSE